MVNTELVELVQEMFALGTENAKLQEENEKQAAFIAAIEEQLAKRAKAAHEILSQTNVVNRSFFDGRNDALSATLDKHNKLKAQHLGESEEA